MVLLSISLENIVRKNKLHPQIESDDIKLMIGERGETKYGFYVTKKKDIYDNNNWREIDKKLLDEISAKFLFEYLTKKTFTINTILEMYFKGVITNKQFLNCDKDNSQFTLRDKESFRKIKYKYFFYRQLAIFLVITGLSKFFKTKGK